VKDVTWDRHGKNYYIAVSDPAVELAVQDVRTESRHLLLTAARPKSRPGLGRVWDRFVCGHDERHWFVPGVVGATSVCQAKEELKPAAGRASQDRNRVRPKDRNRRHNAGFVRQGEWFFIPAPDLVADGFRVLHNEPIRRGRGKSHFVEFLLRRGGTTVRVCRQYPNGLTEREYAKLIRQDPDKTKLAWCVMAREPEAYARGRVRHPDHKTVILAGWHRIVANEEKRDENVAFLD